MGTRLLPGFCAAFFAALPSLHTFAQCSLTAANSCVCRTTGANSCDLLPDLTISWVGLQNYASGPSEYPQSGSSNAGRLRVTGSTPNIGYGPLEVRTADQTGLRRFVCGTDTFSVGGQTNFSCPNGENPKQIIFQQVYRKQGNAMSRSERQAGSMTYHAAHSHYHVNDWTTMNLCMEDPNEPDPRKWPVVATGAKIGFCLMDFGACSSYPGHCRSSQEYGGGVAMNGSGNYPNYGIFGSYGCGTNVQGISVGRTDIYSKNLDMMWINMMDGLCNGNYWIVAEVDPTNVFQEENDDNNWTAIPFSLTQQRPTGSGGTATILAENGLTILGGQPVRLTATPGYSYAWSNGATTRTIEVSTPGNYSVTVAAPCGSLASGSVTVAQVAQPAAPIGVGDVVLQGDAATLSASGNDLHWFDAPSGGQILGTGEAYNTTPLQETSSYWVAARTTVGGVQANAAKPGRSAGSLNAVNTKQFLIFDAYEPFELTSVKVYATGNGDRHFVLVDNVGNLIEERYVYVRDGEQRVQLDFKVPVGTAHRISAFDDNTEIVQNLHRDNSGVSYPYAIGSWGSITGSTGGASVYYYLYDWEVRTPAVEVFSDRVEVVAEVRTGVKLRPRMFLEGPYNSATGLMRDDLRATALLPLTEPYTALGYNFISGGGTTAESSMFQVQGEEAVVDWVFVEIRSPNAPSLVVATSVGLLQRNGHVVSVTGEDLSFRLLEGEYHVAFRHRNHLGVMSASPMVLSEVPTVMDMTLSATQAWGTNARKQIGAAMVLWSGNTTGDERLKYTGSGNDRDPILAAVGGLVPTSTVAGYLLEDTNMDAVVRYTGAGNDRDPILSNIGGIVPTEVRLQQLP